MPARKLNICIVTGDFPALTETFITNKVLELHKRGHTVTVIKNDDSGNINTSHLKLVKDSGIKILSVHDVSSFRKIIQVVSKHPTVFASSFSVSPATLKSNFRTKLQMELLGNQQFDIIHFEFSGLAISYMDVIKKIKYKKVVSCRGTAEKVKPVSDPKRKDQLQELFIHVDSIHCVSDDMAQTIAPWSKDTKKVFINRPSIDAEVFKRTKPYVQNQPFQILTIGRFTFQKGYLLGLLAMHELKQKGSLSKKIV